MTNAPEMPAEVLERVAHNLSADFGPDFVSQHKEFAIAAYQEFAAALTSTKAEPSRIAEIRKRHIADNKFYFWSRSGPEAQAANRDRNSLLEIVTAAFEHRPKRQSTTLTADMELEEIRKRNTRQWTHMAVEDRAYLLSHITDIEADRDGYAETVAIMSQVLSRMGAPGPGKWKDLIYQAERNFKALQSDKDRLTKALERARTYVELSYDENGGEEAAEAKHDLDEIDLALSPPSASQSEGEG